MKRWLLKQDPFARPVIELPELPAAIAAEPESLEQLQRELADRPGIRANVERELALAFAHRFAEDFEAVLWRRCANRSMAGIAGDLAGALEMPLRGKLEENLRALEEFCGSRRVLLIFEHDPDLEMRRLTFEGKTSVIFTEAGELGNSPSLEETADLFADWRNKQDDCLKALGNVQLHIRGPAQLAASLGLRAVSLLMDRGRLAEAYELLEWMEPGLKAHADPISFNRFWQAKKWILAEWNEPLARDVAVVGQPQPVQMQLWS